MPAGKDLMMRVESHLSLEVGKTMKQIREAVTTRSTPRAIRYAVSALIADGRAKRVGREVFAAKDLMVRVLKNAGGDPMNDAVPLVECFPDDLDGYLDAKADLLHHGTHTGGGGAAAEFILKLAEAA